MSDKQDAKTDDAGASREIRCYAFLDDKEGVLLDSVAESEDAVKRQMVSMFMGWRFEYPDRYSHDEEWLRLQKYGRIVPVRVSVEYA